jgi:hypothetical protein
VRQTKTLHYSVYTQAYDLAKKVEKAYKFERPKDASRIFIQPGYWDASKNRLVAGNNLFAALKQLETTYLDDRGYDFEVTKNVSLRSIDPLQLM